MFIDLSTIPDNISRACYILTVFFNLSLIYLTLYHTKQIVGTYRNIVVTFAVIGTLFSTLDILVRPLFHSYNGCFLFFTLGSSFRASKRAAEIALLVYSSTYAMILGFLAVQFMYRAALLAKPKYTRYFAGWKLALWVVYSIFITVIWGLFSMFVYPDDIAYDYVRQEVMNFYQVEIRDVPCFLLLAYNENEQEKFVRWNSVATISAVSVILVSQYGIMLFCGVVMYRRTKGSITATSNYNEQLQKQVFIVLICQVTAPTLFFHLPGTLVLFAPFLDFKISFHSRIIVYGFSVYPLVDTLILLKVITEYQTAYKRFLKIFWEELYQLMGGDTPRPPQSTVSLVASQLATI